METYNWAIIGSGNGLLSYSTTPLPEAVLTYHQLSLVALTWGQFHRNCTKYMSLISVWKLLIHDYHLRHQWVKLLFSITMLVWFLLWKTDYIHIDGLVQYCHIFTANALEILQFCTKSSIPHVNASDKNAGHGFLPQPEHKTEMIFDPEIGQDCTCEQNEYQYWTNQ